MDDAEFQENSFSQTIPKNPIINLSKRAGIIRQTKELASIVRDISYIYFLEPFVVKICIVAIHNGRKTLIPEDVETVCSLENRDLLIGLNNNAINRTKGLVVHKRRSRLCKPGPLDSKNSSISIVTFADEPTVIPFDPISRHGLAIGEEAKKKKKRKPGTLALQQVKKLQKESDCLELPISCFANVVKDISSKKIQDVHLRNGTSRLIQLATETWIYELFLYSDYLAYHRKAQTVTCKDVYLTLLMKGIISHVEWLDLTNNNDSENDECSAEGSAEDLEELSFISESK